MRTSPRRALALVLTLWLVVLLTALVYSLLADVQVEVRLRRLAADDLQARWLARAGLAKGMADLANDMVIERSEDNQPVDALGDVWAFDNDDKTDISLGDARARRAANRRGAEIAPGTFTVEIEDAESRINLNNAPGELLANLFIVLGEEDPLVAQWRAQAIVDWRDENWKPSVPNPEVGINEAQAWSELLYDEEGVEWNSALHNRRFLTVEELLEVPGIGAEVFRGTREEDSQRADRGRRRERVSAGLSDLVTTSSTGSININTAKREVLGAMALTLLGPGGDWEKVADAIIEYRDWRRADSNRDDTAFLTVEDLQNVPTGAGLVTRKGPFHLGVRSHMFTVTATGRAGDARHTIVADVRRDWEVYSDVAMSTADRMRGLMEQMTGSPSRSADQGTRDRGSRAGRRGSRARGDGALIEQPVVRIRDVGGELTMAATHLTLDFTDHEVRVASGTLAKGVAMATDLFIVSLPSGAKADDTVALSEAAAPLRQALRGKRLRPQRVTVVLPKSQVTTRRVYLPSNDVAEIGRMAQFEAEKHIPFHPERHIVSHAIVKNTGIEGAQVFLAAVDSPVVTRVLGLLSAADLAADLITVSSAAGHSALLLCEGEALQDKIVALVDISSESTDVSIISRGELLFTRSLSAGAKAMLGPVKEGGAPLLRDALPALRAGADTPDAGRGEVVGMFIGRVAGELRRTHEFARREYDCPALEAVLVAGEGSLVEGLAEALGERMGLPGRRVNTEPLAPRVAKPLADPNVLLAHFTCLGAALTPAPPGALVLDLTPPEHRAQRRARRMRQLIIATAVLGLIAVVCAVVYLRMALNAADDSAQAYQAAVKRMEPMVEQMVDMETQVEIIRNFVNERNSALAILDHLSELDYMAPRGHGVERGEDNSAVRIALTDFIYDRSDASLQLSGHARDVDDVVAFRADLARTGFFTDVQIEGTTPEQLPERGITVTDFNLRAGLVQAEEAARPRGRDEDSATSRRRPAGGRGGDV